MENQWKGMDQQVTPRRPEIQGWNLGMLATGIGWSASSATVRTDQCVLALHE